MDYLKLSSTELFLLLIAGVALLILAAICDFIVPDRMFLSIGLALLGAILGWFSVGVIYEREGLYPKQEVSKP